MKRQLLFFLSLCSLWAYTSCGYYPDLKSENCISVNIKGALYVKTTGEALKNIPVEVYFYQRTQGVVVIPPLEQKVASGKSDKNGKFNFKVTIDTTHFIDFYLSINVKQIANYLSVTQTTDSYIQRLFYNFDPDALQNISFEFYKKAILTINLKRTQTDNFRYFEVRCGLGGKGSICFMSDSKSAKNKILQEETAADVYTKIRWIKDDTEQIDSLICRANKENTININY